MAHMGCSCGNDMWDGDGHIVYDVFSKNDLTEYIQNGKINNKFEDIYDNYPPFLKRIHIFGFVMNVRKFICGLIHQSVVTELIN